MRQTGTPSGVGHSPSLHQQQVLHRPGHSHKLPMDLEKVGKKCSELKTCGAAQEDSSGVPGVIGTSTGGLAPDLLALRLGGMGITEPLPLGLP